MAYSVAYTRQAIRALQRMSRDEEKTIHQRISQIAVDPFAFHPNVTRLQNRDGYRLRVGDWRVIYDIHKDKVVLLALKVALRGEVYR